MSGLKYFRLLLTFAFLIISTKSVPIDNGVEVEPQIFCGPASISVTFLLRNNFDGHVFVKNHYNETQCRSDQTGRRAASINVAFSTCGVQRTRSLNPKGVFVNTVIMITFHPRFITKVDRAYAFQCFYMESEKTVATQLEAISELTTVFQTQRVPMPVCRYEVLDAQPPNGQPIRYSIVGQQVFHRWICDTETSNTFCMNVNSCFVYDGLGDQAQLLDGNGCAVDRYLLQNLEYTSDLSAVRESHVFKFADRPAVYFQCQVVITIKEPSSLCPRPLCPPAPSSTSGSGSGSGSGGSGGNVSGTTASTTSLGSSTSPGSGEGSHGAGGDHGGSTTSRASGGSESHPTPRDSGGNQETSSPSSSSGGSSPSPSSILTTTASLGPTTSGLFRTTSNASYRGFPIADDPLPINANRVSKLKLPHRRQRSLDSSQSGQEMGVWDVRAPSIAVFDLDDNNALGSKSNRTSQPGGNRRNYVHDGSAGQGNRLVNIETKSNGEQDYCLPLHSFALLLALAVTPPFAIAIGCYVRLMQRRSTKLYP